jgi:hypothetical protein
MIKERNKNVRKRRPSNQGRNKGGEMNIER